MKSRRLRLIEPRIELFSEIADFSKEFLERTIEVWQPRYDHLLTLEDAREIADNMIRLFKLLGTDRQ